MNAQNDGNPYWDTLRDLGEKLTEALKDQRVTREEAAGIVMAFVRRIGAVIREAQPFDREDVQKLIEAAQRAYDEYVVPLDLPGGPIIERLEDTMLRDHLLPWIITGLYEAISGERLSKALADE